MFVHGGSAQAHWWDFVSPRFVASHRPLAIDLRGHGDSSWSADGAYRLEDYAADLVFALDALGLDRPIVVGHSLGASVSLRLALDARHPLHALVLVDGRASFGEGSSRYMKLLRMFGATTYETLEEAIERFSLLPRENDAAPEILEHVARESFRQTTDGRWAPKFDRATFAAHHPFDFRAGLAAIDCPVLFVRGERSSVLSARTASELAGHCRSGSWVEIAGAHHHVLLDRPAELARAIATFLAGSRPNGA